MKTNESRRTNKENQRKSVGAQGNQMKTNRLMNTNENAKQKQLKIEWEPRKTQCKANKSPREPMKINANH